MTQPFSRPIFWPLALVALGVLWLLSNFGVISSGNLWALLRFWPVFLIALGLDLLVRQRWPWMGNLIALLTVALAVLAVVFAPQLGLATTGSNWMGAIPFVWGGPAGSGRVITESRPVSDFEAVTFSSFGEMTIQQGEVESLLIEAEDNVLSEIRTTVRNGRLDIGYAEENGWSAVRPTQAVRFTLVVKDLNQLTLSGAGNVVVTGLNTDKLEVVLSGAGSLSVDLLNAESASLRVSGAGSITASGQVTQLEARLSGFGSLKASELQSETANVTISGTGSAVVWATNQLKADISGLGSVQYYGQPQMTENISGLGSIQPLGNK